MGEAGAFLDCHECAWTITAKPSSLGGKLQGSRWYTDEPEHSPSPWHECPDRVETSPEAVE